MHSVGGGQLSKGQRLDDIHVHVDPNKNLIKYFAQYMYLLPILTTSCFMYSQDLKAITHNAVCCNIVFVCYIGAIYMYM